MEDYHKLDWDSDFFGYKIAAVNASELKLNRLNEILSRLKENHFKLVYGFVSPEDKISNESFKQTSGLLVDEKVTYFIRIDHEDPLLLSESIVPYDLNFASDKLKSLVLQSGIYSRFKIDPNFRNKEYEKLYTEWIEKSVNKSLAKEVLVYVEDKEVLGFVTLGLRGDTGYIGLLAVDENQRGKAIGKKLVNAVMLYFQKTGVTDLEVVTQKANNIACRFYESCGFDIKKIVNIYHIWIR